MRLLACLLLLVAGCSAQQSPHYLNVGFLYRFDPTDGSRQQSVEARYVYHRASLIADFQNRDAWLIGSRAFMSDWAFFQMNVRRNAAVSAHPWILQPGIGVQLKKGRERLFITLAPSLRLKTDQVGYVAALSSEWSLRHNLLFRANLVRSQSLRDPLQIGVGIGYRFRLGKS